MKISELQAILAAARHKYGDIEVAVLDGEFIENCQIGCIEVRHPVERECQLGQAFVSISPWRLSSGKEGSLEVLFAEGAK